MLIVERARIFATDAHGAINQIRKYTGEPYIVHPAAVVALLREVGITDEATLAAAWLHDVVEDCPVSNHDVLREFGDEIANYVWCLTNTAGLSRRLRKELDCYRLASAPANVQSIKVAYLIDNMSTIVLHDPKFAVTYMREKAALLPFLTEANPYLVARAVQLLRAYEDSKVTAWLENRPHA